jgi:iron complex transport system permease protein
VGIQHKAADTTTSAASDGAATSITHAVRRQTLVFALLTLILLAAAVANVCIGTVVVSPQELIGALTGAQQETTVSEIIWSIRLPRIFSAMILGGALALSGFQLQTFFHNPIASPFVLGVSSGAKFVVALLMVVIVGAFGVMSSWMMVVAAFAGSLAVMGFVLLVSRRIRTGSSLIVAGVMIGYVCSAATDFVVTFAADQSIVNLRNWSQGSFSGTSWQDVQVMAVVVGASALLSFALAKPMGAFQLGEGYAKSVGVNVARFRARLVVLSSVLSACVTAFAGPISFVGIAVPHLVKRLCKTARPLVVMPACFMGGAAFCLMCDLIARCLFAPVELSISTVTAIFGAPVVLTILMNRRHK